MFKINTIFSHIMGIGAVQRQSIISFIWQIAYTVIGFMSTMYFAHAVGASVLGGYFLFMVYFGIINMITDGGFGVAAIKRISEGEEPDAYFSAFFMLRSLFVIVVVLSLITFRSYFVDLNSAGTFNWLLLALIMSVFAGAVSSGVAGRGKMGIHDTCGFINNFTRILVQVVAVFLGFGVAGLAGGFVAGLFVFTIIELRFFDLHLVSFKLRHIKSLFTFSFWIFLTSSGAMIYSYADTVMIGYFLDNAEIGVYRVVFQFTSVAVITTTAIRTTLWPKISRWGKNGDMGHIEESLSRAFTYSLMCALPIFAGGLLLGDKLLYFFYGSDFAKGYGTFVILLIVQIVNIFVYFFGAYLSALDRVKEAFKVTVAAASANIILNLTLIPLMGISGAALATLLTMVINAILARQVLSSTITIRIECNSLLNIVKASILMSIIVSMYRLFIPLSNVWLTLIPVVLGGLTYGILVLKFDKKIGDELKKIVMQMKLPWPDWL